MERIRVNTGSPYDVMIGPGLLHQLDQLLPPTILKRGGISVLITDENVEPLYCEQVEQALRFCGFHVLKAVVPSGEEAKSGEWYLKLLSFMAKNHVTRQDTIFALGGGVVGDLSGFLAATFLRGISFVQLPTTLLSAVDSSVGGKTAINLAEGKNLVGAFYQPAAVIMDTDTLHTLDTETFADGCAEIIKYAMIWDETLFQMLKEYILPECREDNQRIEQVISRCVSIKQEVVSQDERDKGLRNILNFGHTIGHSIEKNSGFVVSHGKAVAIGMALVTKAAERAGICKLGVSRALTELLTAYGLPTETTYSVECLEEGLLSDKKIEGKQIHLILPKEIGNCYIHNMELADLKRFFMADMD